MTLPTGPDRALDVWADDDIDDGAGPWALGDDRPEPLALWDDDDQDDIADPWLDDQLERLGRAQAPTTPSKSDMASGECRPQSPEADARGTVLRRAAPARRPRRRRADPDAAADLPAPGLPGYVRDRRGTWRYAATGEAVPGARDLTLRSLYRFPDRRGTVLVPLALARTEAELAWCLAWTHTLTTHVSGRGLTTVLRVPVGEWERRADVPFGLWAPELTAGRLLGIGDVARLARVTPATITAYLSRRRMPAPVTRTGSAPVWSRPVIDQWLAGRPGQGTRRKAARDGERSDADCP